MHLPVQADTIARDQFANLLGGTSYVAEGSGNQLSDVFQNVANRILDETEATHVLAYCSGARAGFHDAVVAINPSVGEARTPLEFRFNASGFGAGCRAFVEASCDGVECGGFNCGTCNEESEVCDAATNTCENECLFNNKCSGESHSTTLGYTLDCNFPASVQTCNGDCVDLETSATNCGACDVTCPTNIDCAGGICQCPGINPAVCDENGTKSVPIFLMTNKTVEVVA